MRLIEYGRVLLACAAVTFLRRRIILLEQANTVLRGQFEAVKRLHPLSAHLRLVCAM